MLFCFSICASAPFISVSEALTPSSLVDQRPEDLWPDALTRLLRIRDVRRGQHHADPRDEIEHRDDIVVDNRGDAHLRRPVGLRRCTFVRRSNRTRRRGLRRIHTGGDNNERQQQQT
jgi:hypothetical protein